MLNMPKEIVSELFVDLLSQTIEDYSHKWPLYQLTSYGFAYQDRF